MSTKIRYKLYQDDDGDGLMFIGTFNSEPDGIAAREQFADSKLYRVTETWEEIGESQ